VSRYARSYAKAFLETMPVAYDVDAFLENASAISRALAGDPRVKAFLAAPAIPIDAKRRVSDDLGRRAGIDDFGRRFLALVLEKRRILALAEILSALRSARDRALAIVEAVVTVAAPVGEPERRQIEEALALQVGRGVRMRVEVDPRILAGFVARVGSEVFDASAARAVERFQGEAREGSPAIGG
jgi:F-type H+-transporting ATPase subunit delta